MGCFVSKFSLETPHIAKKILSYSPSPIDIEEWRTVNSAWRDFIDKEKIKDEAVEDGNLWLEERNRKTEVEHVSWNNSTQVHIKH